MAEVYGSGPLYYELTIGGSASSRGIYESSRIGFHSLTPTLTSDAMQLGIDLRGYNIVENANVGPNAANALYIGDTAMLAVDEIGRFWAGKNGVWFSGGNPSARTAPLSTSAACNTNIMPAVAIYTAASSPALTFTANFSNPVYPVPTGFRLFSDFPTEPAVIDVLATPSNHGGWATPPTPVVDVLDTPISGTRNTQFGGRGRVAGTVKTTNTPTNTPAHRRVRLYRDRDAHFVAEQWSDPVTGAYSFDYVDPLHTYTVLSYDHTGTFRAVVADNLTPTIIPDFKP